MKFSLIIIGNELLLGKIQDLNVQKLGQSLLKMGHSLTQVQIIKDDKKAIEDTIKVHLSHADIVLTSGGLGPTKDDITKSTIASMLGKQLIHSEQALKITLGNYARYDREYTPLTHHYHLIPKDCEAINNPTGFAPCLKFKIENKFLYCLPGVPHEFANILEQEILPKIQQNNEKWIPLTIKTFGLPESKIFNRSDDTLWNQLSELGEVSSLPHISGVDIGIFTSLNFQDACHKVENILNKHQIAENIIGIYPQPKKLEEIIVEEACNRGLTFGFAESCTGGLNSHKITNISGSSNVFMGSVISYDNKVKTHQLGVKESALSKYGAVSEQTAIQMAVGLRERLKLDIAIATTGIAGPGGGSKDKPVGTVAIAIATKHGSYSQRFQFKGNRDILKERFSQKSLLILLMAITKFNDHDLDLKQLF